MKLEVQKLAFNRGLVSRLGLARADIKRLAFAAEVHTNWMPRVLGSMSIRPGLGYLGSTYTDAAARFLPFVFSVTDKALVELTALKMRVWVSNAPITRASVSSAVVNTDFTTDVASWTDADEVGGTSSWVSDGGAGGYMQLVGNGSAFAIRRQQVTVSAPDQNVEHALRIVIARGPVILRVGSASGDDSLINETTLDTGTHSLAFTPTGASFWVEFKSRLLRVVWVDRCAVEAAGVMDVTTPWAAADLGSVRVDQSGDILYAASAKATVSTGYQQYQIQRRATRSWSVVLYQSEDGPFRVQNVTTTTIAASAITGNITLTASKPLFRSGHVGAIFAITSVGQIVAVSVTAENVFSDPILITGTSSSRIFTIIRASLSGTGSTVTLQRSLTSNVGPWEDVTTYTTDATITFNDALDNVIAWYRIGVKTGNYVAGTHVLTLSTTVGSITGVARITAFTNSLSVSAEVITALGGTTATEDWAEGEWSDYRGWPTSVVIHEGRIWFAGRDGVWGSVSDAFYSFSYSTIGDSGPIARTIGSGPVDTINWILPLQRLLLGGQGSEFSCRSSSLDEPLTPTNFNIKPASTQGSAAVAAVKVDTRGIYVQRGGTRIYELSLDEGGAYDYGSSHLSALVPEIGRPGINRMAVQRQPDTRVHCVRSDGTAAVLVFDKVESVICWLEVETDGLIEDVVVLPGAVGEEEDVVYYVVQRTINGSAKRYLEKWAMEADCLGDELCNLADSYVSYTGVSTTTVTAAHLAGESVVIWADGADVGTDDDDSLIYTLNGSGQATLPTAVTNYVVGLPYTAQWKSAKLVELAGQPGMHAVVSQSIKGLGLLLADVHAQGLRFGPDFVNLDRMPLIEDGAPVDPDSVRQDYAESPIVFPGEITEDARICLEAQAPRPCTVLAAIALVDAHA